MERHGGAFRPRSVSPASHVARTKTKGLAPVRALLHVLAHAGHQLFVGHASAQPSAPLSHAQAGAVVASESKACGSPMPSDWHHE